MKEMITVIIPVHESTLGANKLRKQFAQVDIPIEVIFVVNKNLKTNMSKKHIHEKIIIAEKTGRGFSLIEGARHAKGEIILFLHSDTMLPSNWSKAIRTAMANDDVVGGVFSLSFDKESKYQNLIILFAKFLFLVKKEMYGDHAIFIRSKFLKGALQVMNVPIMEDIRLSSYMKKKGKIVMLKERVITSSEAFEKHGLLGNTFRIIRTRFMYSLGKNPEEIYKYYYTKS